MLAVHTCSFLRVRASLPETPDAFSLLTSPAGVPMCAAASDLRQQELSASEPSIFLSGMQALPTAGARHGGCQGPLPGIWRGESRWPAVLSGGVPVFAGREGGYSPFYR